MVDSRVDPDREVTLGQSLWGNGPGSLAARDLLGNGTTREERSINMASAQRMNRRRLKNLAVIALGLGLASLGAYNIVVKATGSLMDDGVFWKSGPGGVVASRVAPGGPAARARRLFALAPRRPARPRGAHPAAAPGQRHPVLLPLAGRILQPRGGHHRHAAPARRPLGRPLLHDLRPFLPGLLDVLHGPPGRRGLGALLGGPPGGSLPAGGVPALLPELPGAAAQASPDMADPRDLHAGPGPGGSGLGQPGPPGLGRGRHHPVADQRGHGPRQAPLLRGALRDLVRGAPRLLPADPRPHRPPPDEVARLGDGGGGPSLLRLLRDPLRAGPRTAPRHGAGRL